MSWEAQAQPSSALFWSPYQALFYRIEIANHIKGHPFLKQQKHIWFLFHHQMQFNSLALTL